MGGVVARGPHSASPGDVRAAQEALRDAGSEDVEVLLNRGYAALRLGSTEAALPEFQAALATAPENHWAWIGQGLARFFLDDYVSAEQSFQRAADLDARSTAAWMNLAMTLEEQGKNQQAKLIWKRLIEDPGLLSIEDRHRVEQALKEQE